MDNHIQRFNMYHVPHRKLKIGEYYIDLIQRLSFWYKVTNHLHYPHKTS
jgi:hypothetical protein